MNFKELETHHDEIWESLSHRIANDNSHGLYKLLPAPHESTYSLRRARPFNMPRFKTDRFKNRLFSIHVLSNYLMGYNFRIDSIRIPRQSWDEYALIMNASLMRGTSRQED